MNADARLKTIIDHLEDGDLDTARDEARELWELLDAGEPIDHAVALGRDHVMKLCRGIWQV
jgi:hypothetical protein